MTKYYVDEEFSFRLEINSNFEAILDKISECLKEELGEKFKDIDLEKSAFVDKEEEKQVQVFNNKNQLVAIFESTIETFWTGTILKTDKEGNPIEVKQQDQKYFNLFSWITISSLKAREGGEHLIENFKNWRFDNKSEENLEDFEKESLIIQIPKGVDLEKPLLIKGQGIFNKKLGSKGDLLVFIKVSDKSKNIRSTLYFMAYILGGLLVFTGMLPLLTDLIRLITGKEAIDFTTLDSNYPLRLLGGIIWLVVIEKIASRNR